eukprot:8318249-Pyramimonas_sp.AAC.1
MSITANYRFASDGDLLCLRSHACACGSLDEGAIGDGRNPGSRNFWGGSSDDADALEELDPTAIVAARSDGDFGGVSNAS